MWSQIVKNAYIKDYWRENREREGQLVMGSRLDRTRELLFCIITVCERVQLCENIRLNRTLHVADNGLGMLLSPLNHDPSKWTLLNASIHKNSIETTVTVSYVVHRVHVV